MPKSKEQFEALKARSVEKINYTGVKLFARKGLEATSIGEIAKETGISIGLLYHYYKSKEDLYVELIEKAVTNANETFRQLELEGISPSEKIKKFTQGILDDLGQDGSTTAYYFILMTRALINNSLPATAGVYADMASRSLFSLQSIIEVGQKSGEVKRGNPQSLSILYLSAFYGLCSMKLMTGDLYSPPEPAWINEILIIR